ncbi:MAG: solute symporter family protein, partial [Vulcanimicrobiaceae bacterium]
MSPTIVFVLFFLAVVFVIVAAASASTKDIRGYFAAHRRIGGFQNGLAIAGDYLSAASFLGATGLIAIFGFDGFYYALGWLMAYLCLLLILAEPLRNIGHFTIADVVGFRIHGETIRLLSSVASLIIIVLYLVAQMVGVGIIVRSLIPGMAPAAAIVSVGAIMLALVVFGGMLATTWVQVVKVAMLFISSIILAWLVMAHFGFSPWALITTAGSLTALPHAVTNLFAA